MLSVRDERHPSVRHDGQRDALEVPRRHANHYVPLRFQPHSLADDLGVGSEAALPYSIADHHRKFVRCALILGGKPSPQRWPGFQNRSVIVGNTLDQNDLAGGSNIERAFVCHIRGKAGKRASTILEVEEVRVGARAIVPAVDRNQTVTSGARQWSKEQCVEQTENRRVECQAPA